MSLPLARHDSRPCCRHCGQPQRRRGLVLHERSCSANPARVLPCRRRVVESAPPPAPTFCPACDAPAELAHSRRATPPRSPLVERIVTLMTALDDEALRYWLRRRYVVERARDFGILQEVDHVL